MNQAKSGALILTQVIDPNGNTKKYIYDANNNLTQKLLPDNTVNLNYDSRKNLLSAQDNNSQVSFGYDAGGRLTSAQSQGMGNYAGLEARVSSRSTIQRRSFPDPAQIPSYLQIRATIGCA